MNWALGWALLALLILGLKAEEVAKEPLRHGKICIGTNGRMSVPSNREHHYKNLRDRYTNCTYVDGNLELTWLQDENLDLSFLQHIREVTGYVLISHVDVTKIVLPSLQIIRGRTLFKLTVHENEFALIVTLSKMHNLELPALRDILEGNVGILNNYNLCHIKSINWKEIITGHDARDHYVYKFKERERDCTPCHESCPGGCWGEGKHNCQKFSKINCSPQCHQGRCFGSQPRDCCHLFCAGGCTGPKASDCLACKYFFDDGVCKQECPPMQRYNPIKYKWEKNPDGKYAYGATCVRDCPKHLLKDNGACVRVCPADKKTLNGECVPCNGPCPKTCHFSDTIHAGNIDTLKNCTVLEGSITILDSSFDGFQQIYENFTFGPRYPAMDPSKLEVLTSLHEITGFLNIQAHHENFTNLEAFRNLEIIGGRTLTEYFSSLYIVKSSLTSLNMRNLRKIRSGAVAILENKDLCYAEKINWQKIMKSSSHNTLLQNNRPTQSCIVESQVCDSQCSADGCWGPGKGMCLACKTYAVENECVASCDPNLGLYKASERSCMKCHPECKMTCTGSGPGLCDECKHTKDGPFCVKECPDGKYDHNGECQECHKNCIGGCKGPENTVGPNGCNSCDKVIISSDKHVERCLNSNEECPQGHYLEWLSPQASKSFQNLDLEGKPVCRQCHPLCKTCTGFGFHKEVCSECRHFEQDEQCTQECSADHYATQNNTCLPCHSECNGCKGPTANDCLACKHFKVFTDESVEDQKSFFCTEECEDTDFPHKVYGNENYCSAYASAETREGTTTTESIGIGVGVMVFVFVIFLACFIYQLRQRAKSKEQVSKLALRMMDGGYDDHEPLRTTNISPNLAQLNVVKESALRLHDHPLGCGAFGTVFRGFWEPEGEKAKVPVAIKVLNDEARTNQSKILDEAKTMASLDHPNLLPLLAICMTSQVMLVTPLMPLGCLLDYVRTNKSKIGSKPLLNWCTQIARGMAYLEDRRLIHRDLAARNILVQTPHSIKITDFGLAEFLDYNEEEYNAKGGRMPIKWLAIECIREKKFTHKSDVWAYGVTVWELLTYGEKPYGTKRAEEVPDLLEKGERLPQPQATGCSIEVYMLLIKCWMVDAESRPSFKDLAKEFARMARDPARFLCIEGDKLMRLPTYTKQDEKAFIHGMGKHLDIGDLDHIIAAEEYLNPQGKMASQNTLNTPVDTPLPPATPTQKFQFPGFTLPGDQISHRNSTMIHSNRQSRYGSSAALTQGFSTLDSRAFRHSTYASQNPLNEDLQQAPSSLDTHTQNTLSHRSHFPRPPKGLPVDDEGYLEPSPRSPAFKVDNTTPTNNNAYMHLLSDPDTNTMFPYPPPQQLQQHCTNSNYGRVPDPIHMGAPLASIDNLEYIMTSNSRQSSHGKGNYHELGIPDFSGFAGSANNGSPASSQGPTSIHSVTSNPPHSGKPPSLTSNGSSSGRSAGLNGVLLKKDSGSHEYYNDLDRMHRDVKQFKLQPVPVSTAPKHETTV